MNTFKYITNMQLISFVNFQIDWMDPFVQPRPTLAKNCSKTSVGGRFVVIDLHQELNLFETILVIYRNQVLIRN